PRDPTFQQLAPHLGAGIDQQTRPCVALDDNAGAAAEIARLGRIAGAPIAAAVQSSDHWYAGGSARSQQDDAHRCYAALRNSRRKFSVVRSASAAGSSPRV